MVQVAASAVVALGWQFLLDDFQGLWPQMSISAAAGIFFLGAAATGPLADRVRAFEKQTILAELKRNHYQISNTARALDLERSHLYKKAEQVGIDLKSMRNEGKG